MKSKLAKKTVQNEEQFSNFVIDCIFDKKGSDVVKIDLRGVPEAVFDYFIICEGNSSTQIKAIADHIIFKAKKEYQELPLTTEGMTNQEWILLDYFDTVVHVFLKETRAFYALEDLWGDGEKIEYKESGVPIK